MKEFVTGFLMIVNPETLGSICGALFLALSIALFFSFLGELPWIIQRIKR